MIFKMEMNIFLSFKKTKILSSVLSALILAICPYSPAQAHGNLRSMIDRCVWALTATKEQKLANRIQERRALMARTPFPERPGIKVATYDIDTIRGVIYEPKDHYFPSPDNHSGFGTPGPATDQKGKLIGEHIRLFLHRTVEAWTAEDTRNYYTKNRDWDLIMRFSGEVESHYAGEITLIILHKFYEKMDALSQKMAMGLSHEDAYRHERSLLGKEIGRFVKSLSGKTWAEVMGLYPELFDSEGAVLPLPSEIRDYMIDPRFNQQTGRFDLPR